MGRINILDEESANMIAAGEVVDRPSSALKELIENSVDAGAKNITVYLRNGGNTRIRVCDDGEGILREDLPKTIYRHATSKIKNGYEINGVRTLGFRGEALAAASAVSRMEIISKTRSENIGSRLTANESGVELYEAGCPDGTTVTVDDLFYNVPARRKFMKKDATEASACYAVCEKLALGNPGVSVAVYNDESLKFRTSGDGKLYSVIYSLYGSRDARTFTEITYELEGIAVNGYISRPDAPHGNRGMQNFFVNSRFVRSKTAQAALEEAYRSYIASGKFPAAVLNITVDPDTIDVNVHPAKTEIKFADEKKLFSAVYYAVRSALTAGITETADAETPFVQTKAAPVSVTPPKTPDITFRQTSAPYHAPENRSTGTGYEVFSAKTADGDLPPLMKDNSPVAELHDSSPLEKPAVQETMTADKGFRIIGEAYHSYIIAELPDRVIIVDKHAAHERLLYETLKDRKTAAPQALLFPVTVDLTPSKTALIMQNAGYLKEYGFAVEEFGPSAISVREAPSALSPDGITAAMEAFADSIADGMTLSFSEKTDRALYTVACKAALKAGNLSSEADAEYIISGILKLGLRYCPHGRPFVREISKRDMEKFFDR